MVGSMNEQNENHTLKMIPIEKIKILNPRSRNQKKFEQIISNISQIGLKRPITVSRRDDNFFDLVCGQGRLEAFKALGQIEIPAVVLDIPKEESFLMSLIENLARRHPMTVEHMREIKNLRERGYKYNEIAKKIDMNPEYIRGVLRLLEKGEERLLAAVEKEQIPISIAVEISAVDDEEAQRALHQAYKSKKLRGQSLTIARRIIDTRRKKGKAIHGKISQELKGKLSANAVVRTYRKEVERQKLLIKKAKLCETRLMFIVSALKEIHKDDNYINLLRAEKLDTVPKYLSDKIKISMET
jgi:ParB family transcriptional regulator, chromosome partitioning protein